MFAFIFSLFFCVVCRQFVVACFVVDLLQRIVVLLKISIFMVFTLIIQMSKFESHQIKSYSLVCWRSRILCISGIVGLLNV